MQDAHQYFARCAPSAIVGKNFWGLPDQILDPPWVFCLHMKIFKKLVQHWILTAQLQPKHGPTSRNKTLR